MESGTLPIKNELIDEALKSTSTDMLSECSIREMVGVIKYLSHKTGVEFVRMDMGIPGLPTPESGIKAEIEALKKGKSAEYAQIDGMPELKQEISLFAKNFLDINIQARSCIVTAGSMMGSMISFMVAAKRDRSRQGVLFIDPGFPVQKKQAGVLNLPVFSFDVYNYRGDKLYDKLEEICSKNGVSVIIYSNPNNPSWICFTEEELNAIGRVANNHDIIIIEDLAYFGMDFRKDYSVPAKLPFQPTVAKFTENYILLISSSKVFSYAGQRIGCLLLSDELYDKEFPDLLRIGDNTKLGTALVQDGVYLLTAGASHTAQYGLTAMLKRANSGISGFLKNVQEYGRRAVEMKKLFIKSNFKLLYDKDGVQDLADGFFFTITRDGFLMEELIRRLMCCGLSTISLSIMGSKEEAGVRISTSKVNPADFGLLESRLKLFNNPW